MGDAVLHLEPGTNSLDELLASLGGISPKRVCRNPAPGTATVRDVVWLHDRTNRLYELIDGTLVEKIMGVPESFVAVEVAFHLRVWNRDNGNAGMVLGADGMMEMTKGQVRIPDVSFVNWDRLPGRVVPSEAVPELAPDLAVEVLSEGNTADEMERKLRDYFSAGVKLVWYIDPRKRAVRVYTSPDDVTELTETETLDGGNALPGFAIEVARLFDQLAPAPKPAKPKAGGAKRPKKKR
jgi:Uma2 family endonuclease